MGRALSFSLVAHAAFSLLFLLLSASRQPLPMAPVARPVRLVTYLEPAAPRARTATIAAPAAPAARGLPAPRAAAPAPAAAAPAAPAPAPVAVPRVVSRVPAPGPAVPSALPVDVKRPALGERLARRLASAAPAQPRSAEESAPRIAQLPPTDPGGEIPAATPPVPTALGARPETAASPAIVGSVEPVGYFPHAWYLAFLKEQVYARWSPPSDFFQSRRPPVALVSFRITRAGNIEAVALKEGSGSARFDQSALAAVQGLGRAPALPEQYSEETLNVIIRFQHQK